MTRYSTCTTYRIELIEQTMSKNTSSTPSNHHDDGHTRRDFVTLTGVALGAVGAGAVAWPFVDSLNPSADVLALASVEVDLSDVQPGQTKKVKWRGVPVFIRHRTEDEIKAARSVEMAELPDPEEDTARVQEGKDQWLVMVGVCTHLGCIPLVDSGDYDGYFCPCHGSHYDTSGRIRKGPAPENLPVPEYAFLSDTKIKIG